MKDAIESSHQLIVLAEKLLREVSLDFGMGFESDCKQRIEILMQLLREQPETVVKLGKSGSRLRLIPTLLQDELNDLAEKASYPQGIFGGMGPRLERE